MLLAGFVPKWLPGGGNMWRGYVWSIVACACPAVCAFSGGFLKMIHGAFVLSFMGISLKAVWTHENT
jgi:hypothetical protein